VRTKYQFGGFLGIGSAGILFKPTLGDSGGGAPGLDAGGPIGGRDEADGDLQVLVEVQAVVVA